MKLLTATVALVTLGCAWAVSSPPLARVWLVGAELVSPVETETNVDGQAFKDQFLAAINNYLKELDGVMDTQDFWSTVSITQECEEHIQEIIDKQHLVVTGIASPTEFDYNLSFLTQEYARVIELVQYGHNIINTRNAVDGEIRAEAGSSRYSVNELFYQFGDKLLRNDFAKIEAWAMKTFDEGHKSVRLNADEMERSYRSKYLWPMVKTLQKESRSIEKYDQAIGSHSTSGKWVSFKMARQQLYSLPVDF